MTLRLAMRASDLAEYVPAWPSYRAHRMDDPVLVRADGVEVRLAVHGMAAYRVRTVFLGRLAEMVVPVPAEMPAPLSDPFVVDMLARALDELPR